MANRAVLVYDDDCGFCTWAAEFTVRHGAGIDLVGFSELPADLRDRLPADWERCAHFVEGDVVYSCGEAVMEAFARTRLVPYGLVRSLRHVPGYATVREAVYRWVADHRDWFGRVVSR